MIIYDCIYIDANTLCCCGSEVLCWHLAKSRPSSILIHLILSAVSCSYLASLRLRAEMLTDIRYRRTGLVYIWGHVSNWYRSLAHLFAVKNALRDCCRLAACIVPLREVVTNSRSIEHVLQPCIISIYLYSFLIRLLYIYNSRDHILNKHHANYEIIIKTNKRISYIMRK
jgi:hypothetical protein